VNGKDVTELLRIDDRKQRVAKGLFRDGPNRFWCQAATVLLVLPSRRYPSERHLVGALSNVRVKAFPVAVFFHFWKDKEENTDR